MLLTSPSNLISTTFLQLPLLVFAKLNEEKTFLDSFSAASLLSVYVRVCEHDGVRGWVSGGDTLAVLGESLGREKFEHHC